MCLYRIKAAYKLHMNQHWIALLAEAKLREGKVWRFESRPVMAFGQNRWKMWDVTPWVYKNSPCCIRYTVHIMLRKRYFHSVSMHKFHRQLKVNPFSTWCLHVAWMYIWWVCTRAARKENPNPNTNSHDHCLLSKCKCRTCATRQKPCRKSVYLNWKIFSSIMDRDKHPLTDPSRPVLRLCSDLVSSSCSASAAEFSSCVSSR